jgi:hypothetical protein
VSKLYPLLSILMALALALVEWAFFFRGRELARPFRAVCAGSFGFQSGVAYAYIPFLPTSLDSPGHRGQRTFHRCAGWDGLRGAVRRFTCCDIWKAGASGHTAKVGGCVSAAGNRCD